MQRATETQNAVGEMAKTWATYATVWGSIEPLSGRELQMAQQVQSEVTCNMRIRYKSGVLVSDRVYNGSTYWEVNAVINPDQRNREMVLQCKVVA